MSLEAFGATQGSAQSYIASQRENFFKDYKDRLSTIASEQAEALGLDQEHQEKLGNTIDEVMIGAPIAIAGAKKAYSKFKSRGTKAAEKPSNSNASVEDDASDYKESDKADEDEDESKTGDSTPEPSEETSQPAEETPSQPGEVELTEQPSFLDPSTEPNTAATLGGGEQTPAGEFIGSKTVSPEDLSKQGITSGRGGERPAARGLQDKLEQTEESAKETTTTAEDTADVATDAEKAATDGKKLSSLAGGEEEIGELGAEAEEVTGGSATEFIAPIVAAASIGYAIYDLFGGSHHSKEMTAPPETLIQAHATGVSDAITRGRFAAIGHDSVSTLPAQNSAF